MPEAMSQSFAAPMGRTTVQMTVLASVVMLLVGGLQILFGFKQEGGVRRILLAVGFVILLCVPGTMLLKVRGYEVTPSHVIVRYGLSERSFPLAEIAEAVHRPNVLSRSRRDAGNGGMWSFLGAFSSRELGKIRAYVSDLEKTVVLTMPGQAVVISPDDPESFVRAVQKAKGGARG